MVQGLCQWNYKNMTGWGKVDSARVIEDGHRLRLAASDKGRQGGR
jgi:hypothetical protein